jgi:hypothetical protein
MCITAIVFYKKLLSIPQFCRSSTLSVFKSVFFNSVSSFLSASNLHGMNCLLSYCRCGVGTLVAEGALAAGGGASFVLRLFGGAGTANCV